MEANCAKSPFVKKACRVERGKGLPGCPTLNEIESVNKAGKSMMTLRFRNLPDRHPYRRLRATQTGMLNPSRCTLNRPPEKNRGRQKRKAKVIEREQA